MSKSNEKDRRLDRRFGGNRPALTPDRGTNGEKPALSIAAHFGLEKGRTARFYDLADIAPDPLQPRGAFPLRGVQALADDIQTTGLQEPILLRSPVQFDFTVGVRPDAKHVTVFGHSRIEAFHLLAKRTDRDEYRRIEAFHLDRLPGETDVEYLDRARAIQNSENEARHDLTPLDLVMSFARRIDAGMNKSRASKSLGRSPAWGTQAAAIAERITPAFIDLYRTHYLDQGKTPSMEALAEFLRTHDDPTAVLREVVAEARANLEHALADSSAKLQSDVRAAVGRIDHIVGGSDQAEDDEPSDDDIELEETTPAPAPPLDPIGTRSEARAKRAKRRESKRPGAGRMKNWRVDFPTGSRIAEVAFRTPVQNLNEEDLTDLIDEIADTLRKRFDEAHGITPVKTKRGRGGN